VNQPTTTQRKRIEDQVKWLVDLRALLGATVTLETKDGVKRSGKITKIVNTSFKLGKRDVVMPFAVELNGDPGDHITFTSIARFDVAQPIA